MARHEGLKAVAMLDAVAEKRISALWVMATNPAVSLPRADHVLAALKGLDLFVVSENVHLERHALRAEPDFILPAAAWGEKDGTVTNSERRISRQRAFLPLPGEVRPDWWIICEVARRLGFGAGLQLRRSLRDLCRARRALGLRERRHAAISTSAPMPTLDQPRL